jgi:hypothetical protein
MKIYDWFNQKDILCSLQNIQRNTRKKNRAICKEENDTHHHHPLKFYPSFFFKKK